MLNLLTLLKLVSRVYNKINSMVPVKVSLSKSISVSDLDYTSNVPKISFQITVFHFKKVITKYFILYFVFITDGGKKVKTPTDAP